MEIAKFPKPSRNSLLLANKRSLAFGAIIGFLDASWEILNRLWEHVALSWLAEHLHSIRGLISFLDWTVSHPWLFAGLLAMAYSTAVVIQALMLPDRISVGSPHSELVNFNSPRVIQEGTGGVPHATPSGLSVQALQAPRIIFTEVKERRLVINPDPMCGLNEPLPGEISDHRSYLLQFLNAPISDGTIPPAADVVARLRFYSRQWEALHDIDAGVWKGAHETSITINGQPAELFLLGGDKADGWFTLDDKRTSSTFFVDSSKREYKDEILYVEEIDLHETKYYVETRLTERRTSYAKSFFFSVSRNRGDWTVKAADCPVSTWTLDRAQSAQD